MKKTVVNIGEISYKGFDLFMGFLYTDKLDLHLDKEGNAIQYAKIIMEIMALSDKFKVRLQKF